MAGIKYRYLNHCFDTAQENMTYDETLLHQHTEHLDELWMRVYTWPNPGITIPKSRHIPHELESVDIGRRITGGGIVFHAPGDSVFSVIMSLDNPYFPKPLKQKMGVVTNWFETGLNQCGLSVQRQSEVPTKADQNLRYCKTYHNPNELMVGSEKILGMTLKRCRFQCIIQGIVHLSNNAPYFPNVDSTYLLTQFPFGKSEGVAEGLKTYFQSPDFLCVD